MQLWYASPDLLCDEAIDRHCRALLTPEEVAQAERFRQPQHRRQHVLTRYMVRTLLGQLAGVAGEHLVFGTNRYGKPHVTRPGGFPWSFNVSHSTGIVVCGLTAAGALGVDVEPIDRDVNVELADRYFSTYETAALRLCPAERQPIQFLRYWTLKEAFIKAIGTGLSTPLADFGFALAPEESVCDDAVPRLHFVRGDLPPPAEWSFQQFVLDERWLVGVAWHTGAARPFECEVRRFDIAQRGKGEWIVGSG